MLQSSIDTEIREMGDSDQDERQFVITRFKSRQRRAQLYTSCGSGLASPREFYFLFGGFVCLIFTGKPQQIEHHARRPRQAARTGSIGNTATATAIMGMRLPQPLRSLNNSLAILLFQAAIRRDDPFTDRAVGLRVFQNDERRYRHLCCLIGGFIDLE